jgi:undecaprenyl diphosphate synthase
MSLRENIISEKLPQHIAVIMDGNGRWAKQYNKNRVFGHTNGVKAVRETAEACAELGVKHLTLYAFSTENWNRPQDEVSALMKLLLKTIRLEIKTLNKNDIRLRAVGNIEGLPHATRKELEFAIEATKQNKRMDLILALNYSGKSELVKAMQQIANEVKNGTLDSEKIDEQIIADKLYTKGIPDPELMIRTSGEHRLSNFLLWQLAYAEFYFTDLLWPDFDKEELYKAIISYQQRERRFGKTSEQITLTKAPTA